MGLTGANGFPCCGKKAVEIVEMQNEINSPQSHPQAAQEEEEAELEDEFIEQEPLPKVNLDKGPDPDPQQDELLEMETELYPTSSPEPDGDTLASSPEPEGDTETKWKVTVLECSSKNAKHQEESLQPYNEPLPRKQWSRSSNTSHLASREQGWPHPEHRSIHIQTSKHLFWANKLIQASEHSLEQAISMQGQKSGAQQPTLKPEPTCRDTPGSEKPQTFSAHPDPPATSTQRTPSSCLSSSNLPQAIGLEELINFASSLAIASSNNMELPCLEHMIKAPPYKCGEPQPQPVQPAPEKPEKAPGPAEPWKAQIQKDKGYPCPFLHFSKPGIKKATIEGEVKVLPSQAVSTQLQEAKEDSVPGTKKGNPLLLKIHFKLSSPSTPEK